MRIKLLLNLTLMVFVAVFVSACGGSSSSTPTPISANATVTTPTYKVEYIPVTTAAEGKTTYMLRLTNISDGKAAAGKTISLVPTMTMSSMSSHITPFETLKDNSDGTYSGTIYFLMPSTMADGSSMGKWELKFTVDNETAIFNPAVAMAMGTTPKISLKGISDKSGGSSRTYYLFNDGISGNTAKLFIAAVDVDGSMMTKFPAVSIGTSLTGLTVNTMTVEVSSDKTTWTALTDDGNGHWSKTGLAMLSTGTHLYVRLTINGEQKTTDGAVVGASNSYGDFTVAGM
jgi:hypothetical protein